MSRYDFHKGFDSRWYVTFNGVAIAAYPSRIQAAAKWCTHRRCELAMPEYYARYEVHVL